MFDKEIDKAKEGIRVYQQVRRAQQEGLSATLTLDEWLDTITVFEGLCAYCKHKPFEVLDHLIPVPSGGGTTANNCVPACRSCNSKKGSQIADCDIETYTIVESVTRIQGNLRQNPALKRVVEEIKQKISILFPFDVLEHIRVSAKKHQRSLNGEVIWALQQYLEQQEKDNK